MSRKTTLKHPLSAPLNAGIENLRRLNLFVEAGPSHGIEEIGPFLELVVSSHAPGRIDDLRLNVAATDDEFRQKSIDCLLAYVDTARQFPKLRQVNIHPAPKRWLDESQTRGAHGDYDRLIDGCRQIADHAARWGTEIVLENYVTWWAGIPDDMPADQVDWSIRNESFGVSPEEWIKICEDVDRPNFALCLDSSHVSTYAHTFADPDRREEVVMAFVAKPHLIRHVHWNDNYLYDSRGRADSHALIGKGSLPVELHRVIKGLDATLHIEHFYTIEGLEEELDYIEAL